MLKKIIALLTVIGIIGLGFLFLRIKDGERAEQLRLAQIQAAIEPLQVQRQDLVYKEKALNSDFIKNSAAAAAVEIIFTSADKQLYSDVFPITERYDVTGIIALSENSLPGLSDCISKVEFEKLLNAGWTYCLLCNNASNFEKWYESISSSLSRLRIAVPDCVYFNDGEFTPELQAAAEAAGFTVCIHHGENKLPILIKDSASGGVWLPGACPMNTNTITYLGDAFANHANIIYTVSFGKYSPDRFDKSTFATCLRVVSAYTSLRYIFQTDISSARASFAENDIRVERLSAELASNLAVIQAQIEEIDAEINNIYIEYGYTRASK